MLTIYAGKYLASHPICSMLTKCQHLKCPGVYLELLFPLWRRDEGLRLIDSTSQGQIIDGKRASSKALWTQCAAPNSMGMVKEDGCKYFVLHLRVWILQGNVPQISKSPPTAYSLVARIPDWNRRVLPLGEDMIKEVLWCDRGPEWEGRWNDIYSLLLNMSGWHLLEIWIRIMCDPLFSLWLIFGQNHFAFGGW